MRVLDPYLVSNSIVMLDYICKISQNKDQLGAHPIISLILAAPEMNRIMLQMHITTIIVHLRPQKTRVPIVLAPLPGSMSRMKTFTMMRATKNAK